MSTSKPPVALRAIAFVLVSLAVAVPAAAATTFIEQVAETGPMLGQPGRTSTQRIWLDTDLICMEDADAGTTTIIRPEAGTVVLVDRGSQSYTEFTLAQFTEIAEAGMAMLKALGGEEGTKVEVTATGASETIGTWKADEVLATIAQGPMVIETRMWLSKDVPVDMAAFRRIASLTPQGPVGELQERLASFEGYPVKAVTTVRMMGQEMTSTTIVKQVKPGPDDPGSCIVPATYTKEAAERPGMPAMPDMPKMPEKSGAGAH